MRVLVTRPHEDALRTALRLAAAGHEAVLSPVVNIVPRDVGLPPGPFDAIIATSAHSVAAVDVVPRTWAGAPWLVVGGRLVTALSRRGFGTPEVVASDVAALLQEMDARYPPPFRFVYLAGTDRKPHLEDFLRARGHAFVVVETYDAKEAPGFAPDVMVALRAGQIAAVLHFSRRSASLFVKLLTGSDLVEAAQHLRHIAISVDAAGPLRAQGWPAKIADSPDEDGMIRALA